MICDPAPLSDEGLELLLHAAKLSTDELLEELVDHPVGSDRYAAALKELRCRGVDRLLEDADYDDLEVGPSATGSL